MIAGGSYYIQTVNAADMKLDSIGVFKAFVPFYEKILEPCIKRHNVFIDTGGSV